LNRNAFGNASPRAHRSGERLHGEISAVPARAFLDRASALRFITAVALQTTTIWCDRSTTKPGRGGRATGFTGVRSRT
jgi:hypothetical protein